MLKSLKVLARNTFAHPIHTMPGDTVALYHGDGDGHPVRLVEHVMDKAHVFTEGVVFDGKFEGRPAIGGVFLEP